VASTTAHTCSQEPAWRQRQCRTGGLYLDRAQLNLHGKGHDNCKDPICLRPLYSTLPCYSLLNPVRERQRRKANKRYILGIY